MPCYDPPRVCQNCRQENCPGIQTARNCIYTVTVHKKGTSVFDFEGALCDVLTMLENNHPDTFEMVNDDILAWWKEHQTQEQEKIKKEALAKLSPKERRALGFK